MRGRWLISSASLHVAELRRSACRNDVAFSHVAHQAGSLSTPLPSGRSCNSRKQSKVALQSSKALPARKLMQFGCLGSFCPLPGSPSATIRRSPHAIRPTANSRAPAWAPVPSEAEGTLATVAEGSMLLILSPPSPPAPPPSPALAMLGFGSSTTFAAESLPIPARGTFGEG
eukprot:jgi/Botrbrau1/18588/Bobra.0367s0030.1